MAADIQADIGDNIIHAYVRLEFEAIPTLTAIAYIHMNGLG